EFAGQTTDLLCIASEGGSNIYCHVESQHLSAPESIPYIQNNLKGPRRKFRVRKRKLLRLTVMATGFLMALGIYLVCGLVFAIPFAFFGAKRLDSHALHGSWGFRLLIIPGAMALWPLLLKRWMSGIHEPPEECSAHRLAAAEKP